MERSDSALLMLDSSAEILWTNSRAKAHLENGSVICRDTDGRLCMADATDQDLLADFFRPRAARPSRAVFARQAGTLDEKWTLLVWMQEHNLGGSSLPVALAQFRQGQYRAIKEARLVQTAYGFTAKEAAVAMALTRGLDLEDYAAETGCTVATARWHLKNAMEKADCHNQKQLVLGLCCLCLTLYSE